MKLGTYHGPGQRSWRQIYLNSTTALFWGVHLAAILGVVAVGWSWTGLWLALGVYAAKMFFVTAGNHRYFSHRSYRTSRVFQLVLAFFSVAVGQKGVIWWASHHRRHHRLSDKPGDVHSPREGFWWSHMGWILSGDQIDTDSSTVKDLIRYPELRWLERFWMVPPVAVGALITALGGVSALVWGVFVSQVLFWHASFTINSLSHVFGTRRFETRDDSRNNFWLALLTFGEGWHNNHHHRPGRARQGMRWWEIDLTYYILRLLAAVGLVWDLRAPGEHREARDEQRAVA